MADERRQVFCSVGGELGAYESTREYFGLYVDPLTNLTTCQPASKGGMMLMNHIDGQPPQKHALSHLSGCLA